MLCIYILFFYYIICINDKTINHKNFVMFKDILFKYYYFFFLHCTQKSKITSLNFIVVSCFKRRLEKYFNINCEINSTNNHDNFKINYTKLHIIICI